MKIWMKVSNDKFEIPEAIADTAEELAAMTGTSASTIYSSVSHYKHGRIKRTIYRCIEIEWGGVKRGKQQRI